jgi:hypothetical protein
MFVSPSKLPPRLGASVSHSFSDDVKEEIIVKSDWDDRREAGGLSWAVGAAIRVKWGIASSLDGGSSLKTKEKVSELRENIRRARTNVLTKAASKYMGTTSRSPS